MVWKNTIRLRRDGYLERRHRLTHLLARSRRVAQTPFDPVTRSPRHMRHTPAFQIVRWRPTQNLRLIVSTATANVTAAATHAEWTIDRATASQRHSVMNMCMGIEWQRTVNGCGTWCQHMRMEKRI